MFKRRKQDRYEGRPSVSNQRSRSRAFRPGDRPASSNDSRNLAAQTDFKMKKHADQAAWEEQLLSRGGINKSRKLSIDLNEYADAKQLRVTNARPKFLEESGLKDFNLSGLKESVSVMRDENSDMAMLAKKGSETLMKLRESKAKTMFRHRFWELGGSKIGKAMGVDGIENTKSDSAVEPVSQEPSFGRYVKAIDYDRVDKSSAEYRKYRAKIRNSREGLPIFSVKNELMNVVRHNQIVVIIGETGSGKTTQLTQYLLEEGLCGRGQRIGCTQPRRVAAMSVAKRVADEMGVNIGSTVGYSIRFEDKTSSETRIKYMTDGVLLRELLTDDMLENYSVVIMDEAHERSLHTDILFAILKRVAIKRSDFRLVVTSATLDADKFADFFGGSAKFFIPGRTFEVESYFEKSIVNDYVEAAVRKVIDIHLQNKDMEGDILVFMTGQEDITATCQILAERVERMMESSNGDESFPRLLLLPMYSQLPSEMQARIFMKTEKGERKCIVSTNIAETSLTVDGIKFVVDSGYTKINVFNPKIGMDVLTLVPISQANAKQRSGRAGRTSKGYCWRLYTELQYNLEMMESHIPEIQRTNLGNTVLLLKSLGVEDVTKFEFMDKMPKENLLRSMYQLWVLGALDTSGKLTSLGKTMARFPLDPPLSRMLIASSYFGCEEEMVTIVAMLSVPDVFYRPPNRADESDKAREKFFAPESDHLTLLNAFNQVVRKGFSESFCNKHFIHRKGIMRAREIRSQIVDELRKQTRGDSMLSSCNTNWDSVRRALCAAYLVQVAKMKGVRKYVNLLSGVEIYLHPSSALCGMGQTAEYVVYHELVMTTKEYMRITTAVEPEWLVESGSTFFSLNDTDDSSSSDGSGSSYSSSEDEKFVEVQKKVSKPSVAMRRRTSSEDLRESIINRLRGRKQKRRF